MKFFNVVANFHSCVKDFTAFRAHVLPRFGFRSTSAFDYAIAFNYRILTQAFTPRLK